MSIMSISKGTLACVGAAALCRAAGGLKLRPESPGGGPPSGPGSSRTSLQLQMSCSSSGAEVSAAERSPPGSGWCPGGPPPQPGGVCEQRWCWGPAAASLPGGVRNRK